jgi:mannose-6-phosphate isomerase-like protein (cupin superfamily)
VSGDGHGDGGGGRRALEDHPQKIRVSDVAADATLDAEDGWLDMGVQWVITRSSVAAVKKTVFGITTFPPGARHDVHRHPNAEEVEYLIEGEGVARIGDAEVALRVGEVVFVAENEAHGFRNTSATERAVMIWCYGGASSLDEAGYVVEPGGPGGRT